MDKRSIAVRGIRAALIAGLLAAPTSADDDIFELVAGSARAIARTERTAALNPFRKSGGPAGVVSKSVVADAAELIPVWVESDNSDDSRESEVVESAVEESGPVAVQVGGDFYSMFAAGEPGPKKALFSSKAPSPKALADVGVSKPNSPPPPVTTAPILLPPPPIEESTPRLLAEEPPVGPPSDGSDLAALYGGAICKSPARSPMVVKHNAAVAEVDPQERAIALPLPPLDEPTIAETPAIKTPIAVVANADQDDIAWLARAAYSEDDQDNASDTIQASAEDGSIDGFEPTLPDLSRLAQAPGGRDTGDASKKPGDKKTTSRRPPTLISIYETSIDLAPVPQTIGTEDKPTTPKLPENLATRQFGDYATAAVGGSEYVRFAVKDYLWASPAMRHRPLYFEQPNLERYGSHVGGNCLASLSSTGHFVASALSIPYQLGAQPPGTCVYTLGVYRPGNCTPHFLHISRLDGCGEIWQASAVTGLVFLFP